MAYAGEVELILTDTLDELEENQAFDRDLLEALRGLLAEEALGDEARLRALLTSFERGDQP